MILFTDLIRLKSRIISLFHVSPSLLSVMDELPLFINLWRFKFYAQSMTHAYFCSMFCKLCLRRLQDAHGRAMC